MNRSDDEGPPVKRGRGRPPVITREQVVRAAREVGLEDLRMSRVAEALKVQPAALYHHVRDREELIQLVAWQVLEETEYDSWMPADGGDWQECIRAYATALRKAMLANPALFGYIRLTTAATAQRLDQIELLVGALLDAGFDLETARHALQYVHLLVEGEVRERQAAGRGDDAQFGEFQRALAQRSAAELPNLWRMAEARPAPDPDLPFAFAVDCLLAGMAGHADAQASSASSDARS